MLNGTCHCGSSGWKLTTWPSSVTACNCTICRRYGALWAYGDLDHDIGVAGPTKPYRRDDGDIDFHHCATCGCVTHYVSVPRDGKGRHRTAVNVRMSDPSEIAWLPIRHFDGHDRFEELPRDGKVVKDMWF